MPLIERFARGVVETLGKDDFRRIMNDTLDHMLRTMSRRERMEFCENLVDHSVERMLHGLTGKNRRPRESRRSARWTTHCIRW